MPDKSNLSKERVLLSHSLRVQFIMVGSHDSRCVRQLVPWHPQSGSREMDTGAQLVLFMQSWIPALKRHHTHLEWVFLSWWAQSRSSLTNSPRDWFPWWLLCLTNLAIKINQHTYCEHGLAGMADANLATLTRHVRRRNQCAVVLRRRSESLEVWILWWDIKHFISFSQNRHPWRDKLF